MTEGLTGPDVGALLDVIQKLAGAQSHAEVVATVRQSARALLGSDGIAFVVREGDEVHYVDEDAIGPLWKGQRFPIDACISGWAILHREAVAIEDIYGDARVPIEAYRPTFVKSLAMVPMNRHLPVGAVGAYWAHVHHATPRELTLLHAVADAASTALTNVGLLAAERRAAALAAEANRAKDEFLAMLGHELRNPLAPIVTALQLLRLKNPDLPSREIDVIERQIEHLVRLVDDLLDISRITRGRIALKQEVVELRVAVTKALELASPLLEERHHHVAIDVPAEGLRVVGDAMRLAQAIANLLTNAAKYTEPGGRIGVRAHDEDGRVKLVVTDNGGGIAPELLPRIFEMFVQGPRSGDRAEGGLGLGLALVQRLVEVHGGSVTASSDGIGKGSAFTIELPAADAERARSETQGLAEPRVETPAPDVRLLVVDDNRDAADLVAESLRAYGFAIRVAYDGPTALEVVRSWAPAIAILDIGLPVMDGYELAAKLWELHPNVRVIALSGYGQDGDKKKSLDAGFFEHLVKPIAPRRLLEVLRTSIASA